MRYTPRWFGMVLMAVGPVKKGRTKAEKDGKFAEKHAVPKLQKIVCSGRKRGKQTKGSGPQNKRSFAC